MSIDKDETNCAILVWEKKKWELVFWCPRKSLAWRTAHDIETQAQILGKKEKVIVVAESDYDLGRIKPIRPPHGFILETPEEVSTKETVTTTVLSSAPVLAPVVATGGFQPKKCPYCEGTIPSNGAAQFSHLKKHVNELIKRKILTIEQGAGIRSTKLSSEMLKVFTESFSKLAMLAIIAVVLILLAGCQRNIACLRVLPEIELPLPQLHQQLRQHIWEKMHRLEEEINPENDPDRPAFTDFA